MRCGSIRTLCIFNSFSAVRRNLTSTDGPRAERVLKLWIALARHSFKLQKIKLNISKLKGHQKNIFVYTKICQRCKVNRQNFDVHRRQILSTKVDPRTVRVKIFLMAVDP